MYVVTSEFHATGDILLQVEAVVCLWNQVRYGRTEIRFMTGITMCGEWPPGNLQHSVQNATGASQSEMAGIGQECEVPQKRSIRVLYFSKLRKFTHKLRS